MSSNIGDRALNLDTAKQELLEFSNIEKCSSLYQTEPVGYKDQGEFINLVLEISTELSPIELIVKLQEIEHKMGRVREIKNGPRIIDIDILIWDSEVINLTNLTIPHPLMHERNFVLKPLEEIAAELEHPVLKQKIKELRKKLIKPDKATIWTKKK